MKTSDADRRQEPRSDAHGEARLRKRGSVDPPFRGLLMDMSENGFRVRHARLTLAAGDQVEFEFAGRSGAARAVWNRILGAEAETGFVVAR